MKKILKLENNKEYFLLEEINEDDINYMLIMNVDNETDTKIVKKVIIGDEDYMIDITEEPILSELKSKFKELVDEETKKYV